jgi:hypothetical protein
MIPLPLPPHSKEKGFTPEDDQGEGMREIPEDIARTARGIVIDEMLLPRTEAVMAKAILSERQRIADSLFKRNGFMLAKTGDGKHSVEISFRALEEMHDFHRALCELSWFTRLSPAIDEAKLRRSKALDELGALDGELL